MHMTAEQLRPQFEPFGNVEEVTIIYDKSTHLSKGERPSTPPLNATRRQFAMQTCDLRSSQIPSAPPSSAARSRLFGRHLTLLLTLCAACSATLSRRLRLCHLFHRGSGARCYRRAEREMHAGEAPARGRNLKPHQPCLALAGYLRRPPSAPPLALGAGDSPDCAIHVERRLLSRLKAPTFSMRATRISLDSTHHPTPRPEPSPPPLPLGALHRRTASPSSNSPRGYARRWNPALHRQHPAECAERSCPRSSPSTARSQLQLP